ncbi:MULTISPECIES: type II secretion system major pseudopilin GspG [unclassified Colwellia]|jgi:general secretion pathway protein G|uniref:type II secretion system major pseudopilin GspG n=1 Tax=unclassified Colwellia TaxID=196834 RepID=UPI0015F49E29|nr:MULTISPECIES: type II secretion system major pseudopilin GspG [unclassified Colwellia]MBA6365724.1 type II secretion system major pseudopilin GspG [Colwellia sp. BRX8-8]MBA6337963.1 type II secretion system major pseudopilin GspG [Colwellia sp. BRX8-7]MBA6346876.1 type II secretion system major pseudopilin GspG [Colwellia sp. BRX8-9]MBA6350524.1 type II secretion system major pseudopilin GspG [Colwellia sp. BRX9-1]MBA6355387.1 type II secretion system major pseudopilin GspG [Colwellia sp. B
MKVKNKQRGFTLLEVMVVIVILGLLGSVVVQNLMGNMDTAKLQKSVQDINALETSLSMYKMDNYNYPTTEQGLEALVEETDVEPLPRRFPNGGYVKRLPDDPWGNAYQLLNPGENGDIDIFTMGPDGEPGTEDDIGNWNLGDYQ